MTSPSIIIINIYNVVPGSRSNERIPEENKYNFASKADMDEDGVILKYVLPFLTWRDVIVQQIPYL